MKNLSNLSKKNTLKNSKIIDVLYMGFVVILCLQMALSYMIQNVFGDMVELVDILYVFFVTFYVFTFGLKHKIKVKDHIEIVGLFLIWIIGFAGSYFYRLQGSAAVFTDFVNVSKFIVSFSFTLYITKKYNFSRVIKFLSKFAKILILIFVVTTFINILLSNVTLFTTPGQLRFGLRSFSFLYPHPAYIGYSAVLLISIIWLNESNIKQNVRYTMMACIPLAATLRTRSLVFIFFVFILLYLRKEQNISIKMLVAMVVGAVGILFLLETGSLELYYGSEDTARAILTNDSIRLARESMPFGYGFGTFGTSAASNYYSPLYVSLGYTSRYGLGYVHSNFAQDTFWPAILAQFGVLGFIIYVSILIGLVKKSLSLYKKNRNLFLSYTTPLAFLLVSSTSASSFFNPFSVPFAIIMAIAYNHYKIEHNV